MIAYLSGKIILKQDGFIILQVNGIGYEVLLSARSFESIPEIGKNINLFCCMETNERGVKLYGLLNFEELELFKLIRNISGVGPKAALQISSFGSIEKLKKEIGKGNTKIFEGVPGIGKKKAQKIILELVGKLKIRGEPLKEEEVFENEEVYLALMNLGFPKERIKKALLQLPKEVKDPEEKLKQALKMLGK